MPNLADMSTLEALFYIPLLIFVVCLDVYVLVLLIKFLRRGIKFFDNQEQDRNYRQWLACHQHESDSEKNG